MTPEVGTPTVFEAALQPTVISLNSALAAYEHAAQWPHACELLRGAVKLTHDSCAQTRRSHRA